MINDEWDLADHYANEAIEERNKMKIAQPYIDMIMDCPECGWKGFKPNTPDVIMGHLAEAHNYSVADAEMVIQYWMDSFPSDDDGWPLYECNSHGFYLAPGDCPGCAAEDQDEDRARGIQ